MDKKHLRSLLKKVKESEISIDEAVLEFKKQPFENLEIARVDHHRELRQGFPEVIYGASKTKEEIRKIAENMLKNDQKTILITRIKKSAAKYLIKHFETTEYDERGKILLIGNFTEEKAGKIVVVTGGTSDIPIARECEFTARAFGNNVLALYDIGVAGIHRLLSNLDHLMDAKVVVAIAGMEGALPSVVGGLVDCPVIAVPSSVGYGANFGGVSALLSMLNSCSSGVSVVNIDNGFGAGYLASMINKIGE